MPLDVQCYHRNELQTAKIGPPACIATDDQKSVIQFNFYLLSQENWPLRNFDVATKVWSHTILNDKWSLLMLVL